MTFVNKNGPALLPGHSCFNNIPKWKRCLYPVKGYQLAR